ncbi:MAG: DUF3662 and FHA domain-containing protein [Chloroflexi bacterium]|nr:DUF3662 and FHA domain-containing protein [Chloroflexota bacterium]MCL5076378.1 DUF3662 and FHA domain-containing protein [Chloroflexota bacterium]
MGALTRFEEFIENLMEGSFARMLKSHLQPVELAKRLARAMEAERTIGAGKTFVPNEYEILLCPEDFRSYQSIQHSMERELSDYLKEVAGERNFTIIGQLTVKIQPDVGLGHSQIRVITRMIDPVSDQSATKELAVRLDQTQRLPSIPVKDLTKPIPLKAVLVIASGSAKGIHLPIDKPTVTIGRGLDNNLTLEDQRVSRYHAEIRAKAGRFTLHDLQSTNGTYTNGQRIKETILADGDHLRLGDTELVFHLALKDDEG